MKRGVPFNWPFCVRLPDGRDTTAPAFAAADGRVYSLPPTGYQELTNPVANLDTPSNTLYKTHKFVANFGAELDILPGLKFKSSYGVDLAFWRNRGYGFEQYKSSMNQTLTSWVNMGMNEGLRWQTENYFSYSKQLGKHFISAVLGQSAMSYSYVYVSGTDYQLKETNPAMAYPDSAIGSTDDERTSGGTGGFDVQRLASYFFRFDYNYDERYMLEFTIRRDGSSRFGPGHKWATFPAASLGWNLSNEPWFKDNRPGWIDQLKLRASWGKNGNENIGNFRYASLMDTGQEYYFGNEGAYGTMQPGSSPAALANPTIDAAGLLAGRPRQPGHPLGGVRAGRPGLRRPPVRRPPDLRLRLLQQEDQRHADEQADSFLRGPGRSDVQPGRHAQLGL